MGKGIAAAALLAFGALGGQAMPMTAESKQTVLKESMRKLWAEHVIWTRAYVVSTLGDSPDAADVSIRLLKNQADLGEAFAVYYGKEAGAELTALLRRHILIAGEVVDGAKTGDGAKFRDADKRWHANAVDIAVYLNRLNPLWSKKDVLDMFNEHLALTTKEAVSRLHKKWPDDIASFDKILGQMMAMADDFSNGIIKQFPDKF